MRGNRGTTPTAGEAVVLQGTTCCEGPMCGVCSEGPLCGGCNVDTEGKDNSTEASSAASPGIVARAPRGDDVAFDVAGAPESTRDAPGDRGGGGGDDGTERTPGTSNDACRGVLGVADAGATEGGRSADADADAEVDAADLTLIAGAGDLGVNVSAKHGDLGLSADCSLFSARCKASAGCAPKERPSCSILIALGISPAISSITARD